MQFKEVAVSWKETSYACIKKLGEGGASSVYLMMATSGSFKGKLFAVKFFKAVTRAEWHLSFMKEIHFLRSCSHPSIIRVFDEGMYQDKQPFVVMEYMDGSLADCPDKGKALGLAEKISLIVQLLSALNYLARLDPPGVHRDIKPQNILRQGNNWVLSDFGLVLLVHTLEKPGEWKRPTVVPMAQNYRTPELVPYARNGTPLPPASDVFQLGLVAAELFTGANPLKPAGGMNSVELNPLAAVPEPHSATIAALLQDMLERETDKRITAAAALHRWQELYFTSLRPAAGQRRAPVASPVPLETTQEPAPVPPPASLQQEVPAPEKPAAPVIAILAYGSIINEPQKELEEATASKMEVVTPFPVEFARKSKKRGNAPTLVKVDRGGAKVKGVLFVLKESVTEAEAKNILWRRETRKVGTGETYTEPNPPKPNQLLARTLTNFAGADVVVYTDFPDAGKLTDPTAAQLAELAVASAKNPAVAAGLDGISYLMGARDAGIETRLTAEYEREILKQTQTDSLEAALAKATSAQPEGK
jgi:serine/threonine protein kinase